MDQPLLQIPDVEYDADFSVRAKQMCDIASELLIFGDVMNIECSEDGISISSEGITGKMKVEIPMDDLSEYSVAEGSMLKTSYSLRYFAKMCMTTKLSPEIAFGVSEQFPMRIRYDLGDNSQVLLFIAPKFEE